MPRGRKKISENESTRSKKSGFLSNNKIARVAQQVKSSTINTQKATSGTSTFFDKLNLDLQNKQNILNLILGALILVILGILAFNYFSKPATDLGPSQQTETPQGRETQDVAKENLPGKYTIKEGDTLFSIAEKYYNNGYLYPRIVEENKLPSPDMITLGQVIQLPKIDQQTQPSPASDSISSPSATPQSQVLEPEIKGQESVSQGTGGSENQTIWGEKITGNTYTVQAGDWLSKISGRAYGDIYSYEKIAQANNIADPDNIEVGTVLKIPR